MTGPTGPTGPAGPAALGIVVNFGGNLNINGRFLAYSGLTSTATVAGAQTLGNVFVVPVAVGTDTAFSWDSSNADAGTQMAIQKRCQCEPVQLDWRAWHYHGLKCAICAWRPLVRWPHCRHPATKHQCELVHGVKLKCTFHAAL